MSQATRTDTGFQCTLRKGAALKVSLYAVFRPGTPKETVVVGLRSGRQEVLVYVTQTGLMRVIDAKKGEMKPEKKETKR